MKARLTTMRWLALSLALLVVQCVSGAPLKTPDFAQCRNITLKLTHTNYRCCPPVPRSVKPFQYQTDLPVRVRRPIHTLVNDTEYWDKYNRAYAALRALPDDDPRTHNMQAWMHCAYCNNALIQRDVAPDTVLLIHKSWLFLPWHRWYVYFHERILAKLIDDDTFALPFWNFDNQTAAEGHHRANRFPLQYTQWGALADPLRSKFHMPPHTVDIPFDLIVDSGNSPYTPAELEERNRISMNRNVYLSTVPQTFFGHKFVEGTPEAPGGGTIEYIPHNSIHDWVADLTSPDHENMGNFYSAARDPVFYGLHCNLDRLWTVWNNLPGGRRQNPTESDWLDTEFIFFDENGDAVVVNVSGSQETERLRYRYEEVENSWANYFPLSQGSNILQAAARAQQRQQQPSKIGAFVSSVLPSWASEWWTRNAAPAWNILEEGAWTETDGDWAVKHVAGIPVMGPASTPGQSQVTIGGEPFHFRVSRPVKSLLRRGAEATGLVPVAEEVLEIEGLVTPMMKTNIFDIFINLPEADSSTPITIAEYAGTFYEIPHTSAAIKPNGEVEHQDWRNQNFRLAISGVLAQIGASDSSTEPLVVSIIPRGPDKMEPLFITGVTVLHL